MGGPITLCLPLDALLFRLLDPIQLGLDVTQCPRNLFPGVIRLPCKFFFIRRGAPGEHESSVAIFISGLLGSLNL
jgi:hypothetical protein